MKKEYVQLLQILGYLGIIYLAYSFLTHGLAALQQNIGFITLVTGVGIPVSIASWLIIVVGIIDLLVVVALFFLRNKWTILYAGVWPLVPAIAGFIGMNYFNIRYLQYTLIAGFIYWVFIELQNKDSFFNKKGVAGETQKKTI